MKLAVDSSAFAKRYVQETGSETLGKLLRNASELGICIMLVPELFSAPNRRRRERDLSGKEYAVLKSKLLEDVRDAKLLQLTPAVISQSVKLLEGNAARAMDALHVACALEWNADVFVTSDRRQAKAAANAGLLVELVR